MGQLALHVRFPNESHEPLWARNMPPLRLPDPCPPARPLWSFAKFRGRLSFATPLIGFGGHRALPHICPAATVGGPCWHSVCVGLHVLLVLGQYLENCRHLETHNLGHHRHRPTVRNYTNYNGHQQLHQPAKPHRHQHHPITHHHGRGTLQVHVSCGVFPPCASPTKAPFSRSPLWAHPGEGGRESKGDQPKTWGFRFVLGSTVSTPDVQHATKQSGVDEMCTERQLCLRQTYTEDSVTSCHNHVSHLPVPDELPT